ncbi:hypothetical protein N9994_00130 [bacterium]|nr:hypothetical protein [bacterium]
MFPYLYLIIILLYKKSFILRIFNSQIYILYFIFVTNICIPINTQTSVHNNNIIIKKKQIMENYNRLFLLQPAGDDFNQLKDQILDGIDVTEPGAYAGKVSLGQLNAYSGELKAQALSNFKTIKIDKADGSASETNLAKLLLELQGEGGVEDAIEEANIAADSKIADADALHARNEMAIIIAGLTHAASYDVMGDLESHEELSFSVKRDGFVESDVNPDGSATEFVTEERYSKSAFICTLNGVVQTGADGTNIESANGDIVGFAFGVAPVEGDSVAFRFDSNTVEDISQAQKGMKATSDAKGENATTFTSYESSNQADENTKIGEISTAESAAATAEGAAKALLADINAAKADISAATDVSEVNAAMSALETAITSYKAAEEDVKTHSSNVEAMRKDLSAIQQAMKDSKGAIADSDKALDDYSASYGDIAGRAESADDKIIEITGGAA